MFEHIALADVANLSMGETILAEDCDGRGLPIYSAATNNAPWNYSSRFSRKLAHGTIIVSARGSIGFPRMPLDELFGATQTTITVSARGESVLPRFLFHALRSIDFKALTAQQAIPMLTVAEFGGVSLPRAPIAEQAKITEVLDSLDTTIRQTEAIIDKLKQIKQGLLHDLLTRGIADNGELRPQQSEAPHLYKESALGWIPRPWRVQTLAETGQSITGSTPPSAVSGMWGVGLPFITPSEVVDGKPIEGAERSVSDRGLVYVRALPRNCTLVVCIGSTIGKVGFTGVDACTNQQINAFIPGADVTSEFAHVAVRMHIRQLQAMAGLQAVPIVNKKSFDTMRIPVPPRSEQSEIGERLRLAEDRVSQEETIAAKLRTLKSGLMDDLLTGRVRVTALLNAEP